MEGLGTIDGAVEKEVARVGGFDGDIVGKLHRAVEANGVAVGVDIAVEGNQIAHFHIDLAALLTFGEREGTDLSGINAVGGVEGDIAAFAQG